MMSVDRQQASRGMLDRVFALSQRKTTPRTEVIAGATTFVTAAYLAVVVPSILSSGGIDAAAVTTATILVFVGGTLFMAFYAGLPFVVGPGLGSAALIATTLSLGEHVPWQTGMAIAFWSGLLFLILTLLGLRQLVIRLVPAPIKIALSASLGLFIVTLGFRNAGLVVANIRTNAYALGDFSAPGAIVALIGLAVAIALRIHKITGGIILAIIASTVAGIPLGVTRLPPHLMGWPHPLSPVLLKLDLLSALKPAFVPYLFAFFAAEFFSTMGTTLAVAGEAGLLDNHGNFPGMNGPFVVDSCAATVGPLIGVPSATALIESAAGVEAGGRTGLTAAVTAMLFLLMLLFSPLMLMIPKEATSSALILVGLSMFSNLRKTDLAEFAQAVPPLLTVLITLYSNNFGTGIAAGILIYVLMQVFAGKGREVPVGL
jgi:AGZA family xanthine/uracil permease-like MFS transporter